MKKEGWPTYSFAEALRPPDGWQTDCAILSTYSADLVVVVAALLALGGTDLDGQRKGSRVELVKALEALSGKVRILGQAGRVLVPNSGRPILKLLDRFIRTVNIDEAKGSWHPKAALVRYRNSDDPRDQQWRVWLGSRNLTRAFNWEAGLLVTSRRDGKGRQIEGLAAAAAELARRASLAEFPSEIVRAEFAKLTWDCPEGSDVHRIDLFGPNLAEGLPRPVEHLDRVFIVSPYLDEKTVRTVSGWGGPKTHRTIVSTAMELRRLQQKNDGVFAGFEDLMVGPLPDIPTECADLCEDGITMGEDVAEGEERPPAGLHAKLLFAENGLRRQLWMGSANATERAWRGRNFEIVAELSIKRHVVEALEDFIKVCERFKFDDAPTDTDADEDALEKARKSLSSAWSLRQHIGTNGLIIRASGPPPLSDGTITLQVAVFGGPWHDWPRGEDRLTILDAGRDGRSDFLQVRILLGDKMCSWLQAAPCDPPPDEERDRGLIAQYLDPQTFFLWLRSILVDEPAPAGGGDWDGDGDGTDRVKTARSLSIEEDSAPTVEDILRSWARDPSAFRATDEKVKAYLHELERIAVANRRGEAVRLQAFRQTWESLATELR